MKQVLIITCAIVFLAFTDARAQSKIREGKVTYAISFPDSSDDNGMIESVMGKEYIIYFKDSSSRMETKGGMGNMVIISDGKSGDTYTLMDMMGEKYALKMTDADMSTFKEMSDAGKPDVSLEKGKKKIAGFECKKAVITTTVEGKKQKSEVWYTDEISAPASAFKDKIEGIPGFPLEFSYKAKGKEIKMVCTAVEKVTVSPDQFVVPDDYTIKNMADLMNMMGGQH